MKWEMAKLGDVASFINGYPFKPTDWSTEGLEIIGIQNLTIRVLRKQTIFWKKYLKNTKSTLEKHNSFHLVSKNIGCICLGKDKAWLNPKHIFKVVFDKKEIDRLFFHLFDQTRP